ncbi:MAG TPA: hypothetical protein VGL84_03775 [Gaiellaceae bacterium]
MTFMRNRHERDERFRERMLIAADDYSTGVVQAMLLLNAARHRVLDELIGKDGKPVTLSDETRGVIATAIERVDDAHSRLARVQLLFGDTTTAGVSANTALASMRATIRCMNEWPRADGPGVTEAFTKAHDAHQAFNRDALAAMRGGRWAWRGDDRFLWLGHRTGQHSAP